MLHLIGISHPQDQRQHLLKFVANKQTWIVSDLRAKFDLQRELISQSGFLEGDAILRASELWKTLLARMRPDLQVVSQEFAVTLISQEIEKKQDVDWLRAPGAAQTAYHYLTQLMPILSHPEGRGLVQEWFEKNDGKNKSSQVRWGHWLDLSFELWSLFQKQGFMALPWISGILVNEVGFEKVWQRPLVFDLGAELNQVESDLINLLSRFTDVTVLSPEPSWKKEYGKTLFAYELLDKKSIRQRTPSSPFKPSEPKTERVFKKFTTMIAEVKEAIATVRGWLESGILPSKIAVVSVDIETYWPSLSEYFRQEGIPVQKDVVARLHSFPDFSHWLAGLRLRSGQVNESDLEIHLFSNASTLNEPAQLTYERFRVLFSAIYDSEDLSRDSKIRNLYLSEIKASESVDRDRFVAWSLKSFPSQVDDGKAELLFKRLFQECPAAMQFNLSRWLEYLQKLISKIEYRVEEGDSNGVACLNLMSAENSKATHQILLGLTEDSLKQAAQTGILFADTLSLASGPGFHLASSDQNKLEFEVRWLFEDESRVLHLYVPETDFAGAIQSPSWIWLREQRESASPQHEERWIPAPTRWDELQNSTWEAIGKERGWSAERTARVEKSMQQDLGLLSPEPFAQNQVFSLSASTLENYLDCPFVFAAKKLFRLSDQPNLDLDVDASTRGSLMHALFARLTETPMKFEYAENELMEVIQQAREKSETELADERLWPPLQARYKEMAQRFLAFEKEWRTQFPETQTVGRELSVHGFITAEGSLEREALPGAIEFKGRIDRVDQDRAGHLAVIDYKSTASNLHQFGAWLDNNELQLLLYSLALREGLSDLPPNEIVEAVYYVERTMSREVGLKINDLEQNLFTIDKISSRNHISRQKRDEFFNQIKNILKDAIQKMKSGEFNAKPADINLCERCQWRIVCRAPHLI
jgi:RecB family exonuclease